MGNIKTVTQAEKTEKISPRAASIQGYVAIVPAIELKQMLRLIQIFYSLEADVCAVSLDIIWVVILGNITTMAHLVYRPPLIDERSREKYIQTRKELKDAKKRGDLDPDTYKSAKDKLDNAVRTVSQNSEVLFDSEASVKLARSASVSSGSTGSRTQHSSSASHQGLSRTTTMGSALEVVPPKAVRKGEFNGLAHAAQI